MDNSSRYQQSTTFGLFYQHLINTTLPAILLATSALFYYTSTPVHIYTSLLLVILIYYVVKTL